MDILCKNLLWLALVVLFSQGVVAQEKVSKKVKKTYVLTNSGELQIENKYGTVELYGWDKDEISVAITIMVNHRKKETADDLLQRISPIMRSSDGFVTIGYEIAEKSTGFFANLFEKANPFDYDRSNIQIDYKIYLPKKATLKVKNTFGDVIIEDWSGNLEATVEHGDLWINEDLNKVDISMRYGKLRAKNINYGALYLKNGGLDMSDSKSLRINSSGTDMTINSVNLLEIDSSKDEIKLDDVAAIFGTLKFSTIQLQRLKSSVELRLKIAEFSVHEILDSNAEININQESSEINLNINNFSHRFIATLEEGLVRVPKSFDNVTSKMLDKGKRIREIKATYGKGKQGEILITGKKGIVQLKEK